MPDARLTKKTGYKELVVSKQVLCHKEASASFFLCLFTLLRHLFAFLCKKSSVLSRAIPARLLYPVFIWLRLTYLAYTIYTQNFYKKCIHKVSEIYQHLRKKNMHILTYTQKHNITKNVHTYMRTKPYMVKCIRLLAAAGMRYKQRVHTLYIHIYL